MTRMVKLQWPMQSLVSAIALLALVMALGSTASACPSCKAALANHDNAHGNMVAGYFWSILFLMSMPFAILGSFSGYMYLLVRRARGGQTGQSRQPASSGEEFGASTTQHASSLGAHRLG